MNFILNRRVTISMLFLALTLLGYVSYKQLPVELLPNAELPALFVQVSSSRDVEPSYLESEIIIPLEGVISGVGGVEQIRSEIDSRNAGIQVNFKKNVNLKITSLKLEEKINELVSGFPEGFSVSVQKVDISRMTGSFMELQVRGEGGVDRVRNLVDKEIKPDLENIDGIAGVNVYGGRSRVIEIQLNPDMCKALNLAPSGISRILSQNTQEKAFVGFTTDPGGKFYIHVNSLYTQVSDLENIIVAPGPVHLKDIATVFFDLKEETSYSRVNGKEAVSVALVHDSQVNIIELSHRVEQVLEELNTRMEPYGAEIVVEQDSARLMEDNINEIIHLAVTGGLLAVLILWFFLKNLRLVLLIALSIPVSVYTAFNLFYGLGITINSLTLVGIALAVGMLLDNSVVVLENIYRLSGSGLSPERSALQGTREVSRSIVAATLTTITVFLPFVFSENFLIQLIGHHIGISIISTLLISLVVALLLIPMVTYVILKGRRGQSVFYEKISVTQRPVQIYLVLLKTAMRHPGATIFGAVILLFLTLILSVSMNIQQLRDVSSDRVNVQVTLPKGTTLENTDAVIRVMEERLEELPEKKDVISRIQEAEATLTVVLTEDFQKKTRRSISDIKNDISRKLSHMNGAEIYLYEAAGGGGQGGMMSGLATFMRFLGVGNNQERIVVKGSDYDMMQLVGEDLRYYLGELEFIQNSWVSYSSRQPELLLNFDPILLTSYNITSADISSGLSDMNREFSSGINLKIGEESYDIIIRTDTPQDEEEEKSNRDMSVDDLRVAQIQTAEGGMYRVEDLAGITYGRGRSRITRVNQDKQLEVYYGFDRGVESSKTLLEAYRSEIDDFIATYNLPSGVALEVFHEEDQLGDFKFLLLAAFLLIFMILASVFESLATPFILLFTIPLAAIGSLLALLLTGNSLLNANTLTGFLILLGVVVNNGIILIDYANILRSRGYRRNRSLMMAGLSRIRPILITSITTVAAMLPLAMGDAEYSGVIGAPFAITVIGGLSFSALLTLIFIPTVCMGMENTLHWYRGLSPRLWLLHALLFVAGVGVIYGYVDGLLWQAVYLVALVSLIPGITYFVQTSLRQARAEVIDPAQEIRIQVRNLVKIYDWPGRFSRQWNSGKKIRRRLGLSAEFHSLKDLIHVSWEFVLLGFLIYFTYFFISGRLWVFLLSWVVYALTLDLWKKIRAYLYYRFQGSRVVRYANRILFWTIPPVIWMAMVVRIDNKVLMIAVGLLWALGIVVYITSQYLYSRQVNIERVQGRFGSLRRWFFRMVKSIPLLGRQRRPFKALRGISFEIRTGMFGLLGPNGAGKSTMMRIICGILEQSYGSIWINGLDTRVYREELQGLIGFLPQEFGTYENMTSWEFLDYQAILKGITNTAIRRERLEYVLKSVHMYEKRDHKIGSFSGGMKQRIGIALILLNLPRILIVDEPTAGLDPRERIRFRNLLVELSRERIVIFSTHIIEDISSSCNQVVVVNKGELKYFGDPVDMVRMATGKVWLFSVHKEEFETKLDKSMVIHHRQDENTIQVRYLSYSKPWEDAVEVEANLEDAYLCLLKNMN